MEHDGKLDDWTVQDAAKLYRINDWGNGYFAISERGEVEVRLKDKPSEASISLLSLTKGLQERGLKLPVLLRFSNILDDRIQHINESFQSAIKDAGYQGTYRGVYPIKVNQQQQVVEEVCQYGKQYHHGLETGSKAELIVALAHIDDPEAYVICNGYKDEEYIDLALKGLMLGIQTVLVIEMPGEVEIILERSRALGIKPNIGIRMKPSTVAGGHWTDSGGDRSVFGLNTTQIIKIVDRLKREGMLDCLKMLHYHLGSQIPNIHDIRAGATEATRFYAGLVHEGASMRLLDIGGGLAIDYDGSHSNTPNSRNYSTKEYCDDVVEEIMAICKEENIPHPTILSESGRALVSYYSVLLVNILDANIFWDNKNNGNGEPYDEKMSAALDNLLYVRTMLNEKTAQECLNDLNYYLEEIRNKFLYGKVDIRTRSAAEHLYWSIVAEIQMKYGHMHASEIQKLEQQLSDIYYGNFSLFQSLPDIWAIDQLFPIMPIHRLGTKPDRKAVLSDITCDSEGRIDKFIVGDGVSSILPLHSLEDDEDYILGIFLVGAYQETLGDLHNLLGDTNVVSIRLEHGTFKFENELEGDTVADVLSYVEYDPKHLDAMIRSKAERAVQEGRITAQMRRRIISAYTAGLRGYTYYETDQEE